MTRKQQQMYARIGATIAAARKALNMTRKQLSRKLNASPQNVSKYETGIRAGANRVWIDLPLTRFKRICQVLGLDPADLLE